MITTEQIEKLVNEKLLNKDVFLVDIHIRHGNRISVFLDSDTAVNIKTCAELSRYIESNLDRESEDFELEVSSAGLDQPLKLQRQYVKNIGKELKITGVDDKSFVAELIAVEGDSVSLVIPENKKLKTPKKELNLPFKEIKEAKIVIKINNK
jgi:ribosome maturation factor RimP